MLMDTPTYNNTERIALKMHRVQTGFNTNEKSRGVVEIKTNYRDVSFLTQTTSSENHFRGRRSVLKPFLPRRLNFNRHDKSRGTF